MGGKQAGAWSARAASKSGSSSQKQGYSTSRYTSKTPHHDVCELWTYARSKALVISFELVNGEHAAAAGQNPQEVCKLPSTYVTPYWGPWARNESVPAKKVGGIFKHQK